MSCICKPKRVQTKEQARRSKAQKAAENLDLNTEDLHNLEYDPTDLGPGPLAPTVSVPVLASKSIPVLSGSSNGTELSLERLNEMFISDRELLARVAVADWHARLLAKELAVLGTACEEAPLHLEDLGAATAAAASRSDEADEDSDGQDEDQGDDSALCAAEMSVRADEVVVQQATLAAKPLLDRLKSATNAAASALSSLIDAATALVAASTNGAVAARGAPLVASCQQGQPVVVRLAQALIALTQQYDASARQATTAFELLGEAREASALTMGIRAANTALHGAKHASDQTMAAINDMLTSLQQLLTVRTDIRTKLWAFLDTGDKASLDENTMALAGDATAQPELAALARTMADAELATADRACLDTAQQLRNLMALQPTTPAAPENDADPEESTTGSASSTALTAAATLQGIIRDTHEALAAVPAPLAAVEQHSRELVGVTEQVHHALHCTSTLPTIPDALADKGELATAAESVATHTDAATAALAGAQAALSSIFGDFDEEPRDFLGDTSPEHMAAGRALAGLNVTLSLLLVRLSHTLDHLHRASRAVNTFPSSLHALHEGVSTHLYSSMQSFLDTPRTPHLSRSGSQHNVAAANTVVPPPSTIHARGGGQSDPDAPESETSGPYFEPALSAASSTPPDSAHTSIAGGTAVALAAAAAAGTTGGAPETVTEAKAGTAAGVLGERSPQATRRALDGVSSLSPQAATNILDEVRRVELVRGVDGLGFSFGTSSTQSMVPIMTVRAGSVADQSGRVFPDDHILAVNNTSTLGLSHDRITELLRVPHVVLDLSAPHPDCMYATIVREFNERDFELHRIALPENPGKLGASLVSVDGHPGHVVNSIDPTGAAAQAGLKANDIIIALNCENVMSTPHETLAPSVARGGCQLTVARRRSAPSPAPAPQPAASNPAVGLGAAEGINDAQGTAAAAAVAGSKGLQGSAIQRIEVVLARIEGKLGMTISSAKTNHITVVADVVPNGAAAQAGIRAGDVIVAVDGQDTTTLAHSVVTASLTKKQPMHVVIERVVESSDGTGATTHPAILAAATTPVPSGDIATHHEAANPNGPAVFAETSFGAPASATAAPVAVASPASVPVPVPVVLTKATTDAPAAEGEAPAPVDILSASTGTNSGTWNGLDTVRTTPATLPVGLMSAAIRAVEQKKDETVDPQISSLSLASQPERKPLPPGDTYKVVLMRSLTGSLGLRIRTEEYTEGSVVAAVPEDGPAFKTRLIQRGDYLLSVNGERVVHHDHNSIIRLLRFAENPVTLELMRPTEPINAVARTDSLRDKGLLPEQSKGYTPYDQAGASAGLREMPPFPGAVMPPGPPTTGAHQYHSLANVNEMHRALQNQYHQYGSTGRPSAAPDTAAPTIPKLNLGPNSYVTVSALTNAAALGASMKAAAAAQKKVEQSEPEPLNASYLEDSDEEEGPTMVAPPRLILPREEMTFNAKDARRVRIKRDPKVGFGMRLRTLEQRPGTRVLEVVPHSPAAKSKKIHQGDVIYAINGDVMINTDHETISARIRDAQSLDLQLISQPAELLLPRFVAADEPAPVAPQRERRQRIPYPPSVRAARPEPAPGASAAVSRVAVIGNLRFITLTPRQKARLGLSPPPAGHSFPVVRAPCKNTQVGDALISINGVSTLGRDIAALNAILRELGTCAGEVGTEIGPGHYVHLARGERAFGLKLSCSEEQGVTIGTIKPNGSAATCDVLREGAWVCMVNDSMTHKTVTDVASAIVGQASLTMLVVNQADAQVMRHVAASCDTLLPVPLAAVVPAPNALEAAILDKQFHPADPSRNPSVLALAGSAGGSAQLGLPSLGSGMLHAAPIPEEDRSVEVSVRSLSGLGLVPAPTVTEVTATTAAKAPAPVSHQVSQRSIGFTVPTPDSAAADATLAAVRSAVHESAEREAALRNELAERDLALAAARARADEAQARADEAHALVAKVQADAAAALQAAQEAAHVERAKHALAAETAAAHAATALEEQRAKDSSTSDDHAALVARLETESKQREAAEAQVAALTAKLEQAQGASSEQAGLAAQLAAESQQRTAAEEQLAALKASLEQAQAALSTANNDRIQAQEAAAAADARAAKADEKTEKALAAAAAAAEAAIAAARVPSPAPTPAVTRRSQASSPIVSESTESAGEDPTPSSPSGRPRRVSPLRKASSVPTDGPDVFVNGGSSNAEAFEPEYLETDGAAAASAREQELSTALAAAQSEIEDLKQQLVTLKASASTTSASASATTTASLPSESVRDRRPTLSPTPAAGIASPTIGSPRPVRSQRVSRPIIEEKMEDVDKEVDSIVSRLKIPASKVVCIAKEKYRFFDDAKVVNVRIIGKNVMVRVGGGWQRLEEFLQGHAGYQTQNMD